MLPEVHRWFDQRTSRAGDWPPVDLLAWKAAAASTVAVVLPALNEEATVGRIVHRIRRDLVDRVGLVDELVVMDSGSTDRTVEVARHAGARVVLRADVLPTFPPRPGKGEVLWRALAATTADLVVFVDSDLVDFTPRFVTGLLGPLLHDPAVALVKATYDRAMLSGAEVVPAGGGRVTELVARPLLNLHWPQLAGFVQPLGGEYAARRGLLERLPFPCGYGVEFALLVDSYALVGLDAMAQVDLTRRKHRNADVDKLGRMATEIYQVALRRLDATHRIRLLDAPSTRLTQFERSGAGYRIRDYELDGPERPPLITVDGYHGRRADAS